MTAAAEFDFSHLEVRAEKVVEYKVNQIETPPGTTRKDTGEMLFHPVLLVTPATEANRPYWSESLKMTAMRNSSDEVEDIIQGRVQDIDLFVKHDIVKGWHGVPDKDGNEAEFTKENLRAFLSSLPSWVFIGLRLFVKTPQNFVEGNQPTPAQVHAQGNV